MQVFIDLGYADDVYKLSMMSQRRKNEVMTSIEFLPGHKQRLIDLFKRIDTVSGMMTWSDPTNCLFVVVSAPQRGTHPGECHAR